MNTQPHFFTFTASSRFTPATRWMHLIISLALAASLFGLVPAQTTSAATLAAISNGDGLVAYWNLDEGSGTTAADLTGNNSNLTLNATYQSFAVEVPTLDFGSVSSVNYEGNSSAGGSLGTTVKNLQTITVALWVNPDTIPGSGIARYISLGNEKAVLRSQNAKLNFYMKIGGALKGISVANVLQAGQYQHIAGTYDGSTLRVYRNGSEVGSLAATGTVDTSGSQVFTSSGSESFDGRLDDIRIYNRALSASEITTLYNGEECMVEATGDNVTDYMSLTSDAALENAISAVAAGATLKVAGVCNNASFTVNKNLTIEGAYTVGYWTYPAATTAFSSTLDGENANTVVTVNSGITATLNYLTIANGSALTGAGINNAGTLTVNNSTFSNNIGLTTQDSKGGGIYNSATLTVNYSTFTGNTAKVSGGGIANYSGTATVNNSTFTSNTTTTDGGGLFNNGGTVTVNNSTFSSNSAKWGGGISNSGGTANINSSTFTGNSATQQGGGIYNWYAMTLTGSTLSSNTAPYGGGFANNDDNDMTTISSSTIDGNTASVKGSEYYGFPADFESVNFGGDKLSVP